MNLKVKSPQNILFIVSCLERGGLELRLLDFVRFFPAECRIHICVTSSALGLFDQFSRAGAEILVLPVQRSYAEPGSVKKLLDYVVSHRIKVVNTYDFKGLVLGGLLKVASGVVLIHNTVDLLHQYAAHHRFLLKLLFRLVDVSVCNSMEAKDLLVSIGVRTRRYEVIPNGVDTTRFRFDPSRRCEIRRSLGIGMADLVVGTVANCRVEKNYPFLLSSFSRLLRRNPKLTLVCVGGGILLEEMRWRAAAAGIEDKVIFTGYVDNVEDYLCSFDAFVLCSTKESFPNCLIQAMSVRVPVVASDIGACSSIVTQGVNGFTFQVDSEEMFIQRVESVLYDSALAKRLTGRAALVVEDRYSMAVMLAKYLDLFDGVACGRGQ